MKRSMKNSKSHKKLSINGREIMKTPKNKN